MKFQYVAKDSNGKSVSGLFESESSVSVRQRLRSQGLFALSIDSVDQASHSSLGRLYNEALVPHQDLRSGRRAFAAFYHVPIRG